MDDGEQQAVTIVRPPGLSDDVGRGYEIADSYLDAPAMSRDDLAASLLDLLEAREWTGRTAFVAMPGLRLGVLQTIRKEVLKR